MVFFFESNVVSPGFKLFMGRDKYENEDLIRWGWPEDVWFHVDKLSSAHVYLRLKTGQSIEDIPQDIIIDAAQLVKANSIQGNKLNNIDVVYTMWSNLRKEPSMEVGQIAFKDDKAVKKIRVEKRINEIVNRLNKTKIEEQLDFEALRRQRDDLERENKKKLLHMQQEIEKQKQKELQLEKDKRSYQVLMKPENMKTNYDDGNDSDDFM